MAFGDVWILGAGASAEDGAPLIGNFWPAAEEIRLRLDSDELEAFESVLNFWKRYVPGLNIEQFFGYVDSPPLVNATQVGSTPTSEIVILRRKTSYLISKVITVKLGGQVSDLHKNFVAHFVKTGGDTITFNWDINLDRAFFQEAVKADYSLPNSRPGGDQRWQEQRTLLKLHGSLNWKLCANQTCNFVETLDEKETAANWFLGKSELKCSRCGQTDKTRILMIPPVLTKLSGEDSLMTAVWKRAFEVLVQAERIFIIGYSFPETDLQSRVLMGRGLSSAKRLKHIYVITRPKFGSERQRFEDRYVESLAHSGKSDQIEFRYWTFKRFVEDDEFRR